MLPLPLGMEDLPNEWPLDVSKRVLDFNVAPGFHCEVGHVYEDEIALSNRSDVEQVLISHCFFSSTDTNTKQNNFE